MDVPEKITMLILPLGYFFNADGIMMYQAFATVFLPRAYHIHLSLIQQIGMLLVMLVSSKGAAGGRVYHWSSSLPLRQCYVFLFNV